MAHEPSDGRHERRSPLRGLIQSDPGSPDLFSSERSFAPSAGPRRGPPAPGAGYYIDLRLKAAEPAWPPGWLAPRPRQLHVTTIQWALGAWERHVAGEPGGWRQAALDAAGYLVETQEAAGPLRGAWLHGMPMPHTYEIDPPWASAIAQGEGASLMARLHAETGEERFAESARLALEPMRVPVNRGGVLAEADALPFFEEYPTHPPSMVLNGAIFAIWGWHDVAEGLGSAEAGEWRDRAVHLLERLLPRYDTGYWSRYDLYPHPLPNVASGAYHLLHVTQLGILGELTGSAVALDYRDRFEAYRHSKRNRRRALARKVGFRLLIPRNKLLANRLPWRRRRAESPGRVA